MIHFSHLADIAKTLQSLANSSTGTEEKEMHQKLVLNGLEQEKSLAVELFVFFRKKKKKKKLII